MTGKSAVFLKTLGDAVHQAMVETMGVPPLDRFQVITEHTPATLFYDASYLGIERTDEIIIIQITLNEGRSPDTKRTFYRRTVELLEQSLKVRSEDVMISLVEVKKENWSFGRGIAQYAA